MSAPAIVASIVSAGSNNHATTSEEVNAYATDFVAQGVLGAITNSAGVAPVAGSFGVNADASPDMGITIKGSGNTPNGQSIAYIQGTPTGQNSQILRARMASDYTNYAIAANTSGVTKYDWIYIQFVPANAANPDSAGDNVFQIITSRSSSNVTDNGAPPTYGILLAVVTVVNNASSITNANISDRRTQVTLNIGSVNNTNGWQALNTVLTFNANNGNKEFVLNTTSSLAGTVSPGTRLSVNRSVTPPSECMSFNGTNQYASNSSPSGISFASAFTLECWMYLTAYNASSSQMWINMTNSSASGGWWSQITSSGQLAVTYESGTGGTSWETIQSVPLNQWVHVACVVSSISGKTLQGIYLNGLSVPTVLTGGNTTTITQTGTLAIGGWAANNAQYFSGYLSEVRVWSAAQTQASIQANMTKNLVGNETNLVGLWQGNGSWADATSNANSLTATNGASNSQASNPYNATEYAIITAVTSSTITVFTGNAGTIPNMTLNSPQISTARTPFGFPCSELDWVTEVIILSVVNTSGTVAGTTYNPGGINLSVPVGKWRLLYDIQVGLTPSSTPIDVYATLSTSSSSGITGSKLNSRFTLNETSSSSAALVPLHKDMPITNTADTPYYLLLKAVNAFSALGVRGDTSNVIGEISVIRAECAYV